MLRLLSRPATRLMERWLPDAFIFVIVLCFCSQGPTSTTNSMA